MVGFKTCLSHMRFRFLLFPTWPVDLPVLLWMLPQIFGRLRLGATPGTGFRSVGNVPGFKGWGVPREWIFGDPTIKKEPKWWELMQRMSFGKSLGIFFRIQLWSTNQNNLFTINGEQTEFATIVFQLLRQWREISICVCDSHKGVSQQKRVAFCQTCPCHFVSQDDILTWEIKFTSLVLSVVEQRIHGINLDFRTAVF